MLESFRLPDGQNLIKASIQFFHQQPLIWAKVCQLNSLIQPCSFICFYVRLNSIDLGATHSIGAPLQIYPLFENGFRAHRGQSIEDNDKESARLYSDFAKVAAKNPMSWNYGKVAETEESIGAVTKRNRMICFPCKIHSRLHLSILTKT